VLMVRLWKAKRMITVNSSEKSVICAGNTERASETRGTSVHTLIISSAPPGGQGIFRDRYGCKSIQATWAITVNWRSRR
jgi:hypothetical protein